MFTTTLQRLRFQLADQTMTFSISSVKSRCVVKLQVAILNPVTVFNNNNINKNNNDNNMNKNNRW